MKENSHVPRSNRDKRAGTIPLIAFFIGAVLLCFSLLINSIVTHRGSWPDLEKVLLDAMFIGVAMLYALFFALWALVAIFLSKKSGVLCLDAILAFILNGGYVITIIIIYLINS